MNEPVTAADLSSVKFPFAGAPHEAVNSVERFEAVFDLRDVEREGTGYCRGIEALSLHRCGGKKIPVIELELADLALDHAAHRLRNVAFDIGQRSWNRPRAIGFHDRAPRLQVLEQIFDKQWVAF